MKRIVFLLLVLFASITVHAQEIEIYNQLRQRQAENEKLGKDIERLSAEKKRLDGIVYKRKDEKEREANKNREKKDEFEKTSKQIQGIETSISNHNAAIKQKTDTINYLMALNANLEKDNKTYAASINKKSNDYKELEGKHNDFNAKLKKEMADAENSGMEEGRKEIITNYWSSKYNGKKFDNLVSMSILECIGYDAKILGKNGEINDLLIYYKAKGCLAQKYDAAKVAQAISDLDNVITRNPLSERAVQLKETLSKYNAVNEAFKNLVKKMDEYNYKTPGETPTIKKKKKANYMNMIANFIKSTDYDYTQYEYISNKLIEVLKIKCSVEGIEKNISYILD